MTITNLPGNYTTRNRRAHRRSAMENIRRHVLSFGQLSFNSVFVRMTRHDPMAYMFGWQTRAVEPVASIPCAQPGRTPFTKIAAWVVISALAFHLASAADATGWLMVLYLFGLAQLSLAATWRQAFYSGFAVGLLIAAGQLGFFWRIFFGGAAALWVVYAFWVSLFVAISRLCWWRLPQRLGWLALPFVWCGLEYFRSELYYLRFSWLSPGFAFAPMARKMGFGLLGTYGIGFVLAGIASAGVFACAKSRTKAVLVLLLGMAGLCLVGFLKGAPEPMVSSIRVAGVQMEFPTEPEVLIRLQDLLRAHPATELVVLSEYTFAEPVPAKIMDWCREHRRYLVVGAKEPTTGGNYYDTAFVISPEGKIVFQQGKCVPIQFFKDGLPARRQALWKSPWGMLGICICYDLSYSRVTDRLIREGAEALLVPTMDIVDWGQRQHQLHARVALVRAAEYGVPIFRVASSGISQLVDRSGRELASAPCPGEGAMISGVLEIRGPGKLPLDRFLAPFSVAVTGILLMGFAAMTKRHL